MTSRTLAFLLVSVTALAQEDRTFTVAAVRPTQMTLLEMLLKGITQVAASGQHVELNVVSVADLMKLAYGVELYRIKVPKELSNSRYNISAVASGTLTKDQLSTPVRTLLAERFHLKMHVEQRKIPVYLLLVGPKGLKMTPTSEAPQTKVTNSSDGRSYLDYKTAMDRLTMLPADRPVLDRTGLKGVYSGTIEVSATDVQAYAKEMGSAGIPLPGRVHPYLEAVEQLGLRLMPSDEMMDVYVVDSAYKMPSVD